MNDIKKENETLKQIIDKLVEMIHDIIQPMYKQHYYNFIILFVPTLDTLLAN